MKKDTRLYWCDTCKKGHEYTKSSEHRMYFYNENHLHKNYLLGSVSAYEELYVQLRREAGELFENKQDELAEWMRMLSDRMYQKALEARANMEKYKKEYLNEENN